MNKFFQIKREAKKYFKKARGSHDFEHTMRVYRLCLHIGKKEKADLKVLKLAAILHDIGRRDEDESYGRLCHVKRGGVLATKIMGQFGFDPILIEKVVHCIETHRYRGVKKPVSKEAQVLFDADKLDSIGAIGIGRAFLFAGEVGARLHNKDVDPDTTEQYTKEDTAYREFLVKLRKVKDKMLTREGKRMARGRHKFMVEFFERLNKEIEGEV